MRLLLFGFVAVLVVLLYNNSLFVDEKVVEGFKDSNKVIVLLGDSTLKNESYVQSGLSVGEYVNNNSPTSSSYCYAVNESNIVDVYNQLEQIPIDYNNPSCSIFLSVGGNDILNSRTVDKDALRPIFIAYTKVIRSIQTRMDKSKLFLVNIYYPLGLKYSQYRPILEEWNRMIDDFAYTSTNNISGVVRLNELLKDESDFTYGIEPSESGGLKIADAILGHC
jgi:hypothetical protein